MGRKAIDCFIFANGAVHIETDGIRFNPNTLYFTVAHAKSAVRQDILSLFSNRAQDLRDLILQAGRAVRNIRRTRLGEQLLGCLVSRAVRVSLTLVR